MKVLSFLCPCLYDQYSYCTCLYTLQNTSTKTLLIRNIGNKESRFQLSVEKPFSVSPDSGHLDIGESCQIHVEFNALQTGDHCSNMVLHYDTGKFDLLVFVEIVHVGNCSVARSLVQCFYLTFHALFRRRHLHCTIWSCSRLQHKT